MTALSLKKQANIALENLQVADASGAFVSSIDIAATRGLFIAVLLNNKADLTKPIGIVLPRDHRYLIVILSCIELGITFVPLNIDFPESRIHQIKLLAGIELVIDQMFFSESINGVKNNNTDKQILALTKENKAAYIIFTSGSTGAPKGVCISNDNFSIFCDWVNVEFSAISSDDRLLNLAEFSFDMSMLDVAICITRNAGIFFGNFAGNFFQLAHMVESFNISTLVSVPNNVNQILQDDIYKRANFSSLKYLLLGGARFSAGLYKRLKELRSLGQPIETYNLYGPTEATVYCAVKKLVFNTYEIEDGVLSIGSANLNSELLLIDEEDQVILEEQTNGELLIGGSQVMIGYVNNPNQTRGSFININGKRYYRSGDIAYFSKNGDFYLVGRIDDTLKVRGYRVNLGDIDSYFSSNKRIIDAATIFIEEDDVNGFLVTYVTLEKTAGEDLEFIKEEMQSTLAYYQMPKYILPIKNLPLNASGKICKLSLKKLFKSS